MRYVEFIEDCKGLTIKLTSIGRKELKARLEGKGYKSSPNYIFLDLIEDWLCNGWEVIKPEEIGALTSALILSNEIVRNKYNEVIDIGKVYWYSDYQIKSEVQELFDNGEILFQVGF